MTSFKRYDTPMVIRVAEIFGDVCASPSDGEALESTIEDALRRGEGVDLDLTGVRVLTTAFLNSAFGFLFGEFPPQCIDSSLSWTGLDQIDSELVQLVRENAIRYFETERGQGHKHGR